MGGGVQGGLQPPHFLCQCKSCIIKQCFSPYAPFPPGPLALRTTLYLVPQARARAMAMRAHAEASEATLYHPVPPPGLAYSYNYKKVKLSTGPRPLICERSRDVA